MTDKELKELVFGLADSIRELRKAQKETDEQMKKTDEQMKRTDEKLDKVSKLVGSLANNQGDVAEEYFINSLFSKPEILGIKFDKVLPNLSTRKDNTEDEYDIVLINGKSVAIVEVKYKVHENDIKKLDKKIKTFRELFPEYSHLKLYAGIAGFKVYHDAKEYAKEKGYFVLQRKGDVIETYAPNLKAA